MLGVNFFCFITKELYLFLTVCSVLFKILAYYDHFFPPFATFSNKIMSSLKVHAPLNNFQRTSACWDQDGSTNVLGNVCHFWIWLLLSFRTFYGRLRSSWWHFYRTIWHNFYFGGFVNQHLFLLFAPPSIFAFVAIDQFSRLKFQKSHIFKWKHLFHDVPFLFALNE